jgi:hypothetical protein
MLALNHVETLPDGRQVGVFAVGEQHLVLSGIAPLGKWTNEQFPPKIGDKVIANTNGFGEGTVLDYVIREGWLGCIVKIGYSANSIE